MRKIFKRAVSVFLIPLTRWYLRKERNYTYEGTEVVVFPGVFHPGLFQSTKFLLRYLKTQPLKNASMLELGCGTGLISIIAAMQGATVTACDLNDTAVKNTRLNAISNNVSIAVIESDLFSAIPVQSFDWIIINPPYYQQDPKSEQDLAWHAGKNFEYFKRLFETIHLYTTPQSQIIMVLTQGTNLEEIFRIAEQRNYHFKKILEQPDLFDGKHFIFRIRN